MDNRKYGILNSDGTIHYAPSTLDDSTTTNFMPTDHDYIAAGFYRIDDTMPKCVPGKHAEDSGTWSKNEMSKTLVKLYWIKDDPVVPEPEHYLSRNKLVEYCVSIGKMDQMVEFFNEFPAYKLVWDSLDDGQIRISHPMFKQAEELVKTRFGLSDAEWEEIKKVAAI